MAFTADREVPHFVDQQLRAFAVGGAETIYKGSFVGYMVDLVSSDQITLRIQPFAGTS